METFPLDLSNKIRDLNRQRAACDNLRRMARRWQQYSSRVESVELWVDDFVPGVSHYNPHAQLLLLIALRSTLNAMRELIRS